MESVSTPESLGKPNVTCGLHYFYYFENKFLILGPRIRHLMLL